MSETNFKVYLCDALDILERNCKSFHDGYYPDYRVVAGQLRILLCDTNRGRDNSLALKVFPHLRLHPMKNAITEEFVRNGLNEARKIDPSVQHLRQSRGEGRIKK